MNEEATPLNTKKSKKVFFEANAYLILGSSVLVLLQYKYKSLQYQLFARVAIKYKIHISEHYCFVEWFQQQAKFTKPVN